MAEWIDYFVRSTRSPVSSPAHHASSCALVSNPNCRLSGEMGSILVPFYLEITSKDISRAKWQNCTRTVSGANPEQSVRIAPLSDLELTKLPIAAGHVRLHRLTTQRQLAGNLPFALMFSYRHCRAHKIGRPYAPRPVCEYRAQLGGTWPRRDCLAG